ncbi:MAG: NAD(P)/FAD-dependent oxidoreductase [Gemmatimonadaceae bacterium]
MPTRPRVVIVGAGFGGLIAARKLRRADVDITVIDRTNHHLFQPLLYQVATAELAPSDVTGAIRHILRHQANTTVLLGRVTDVDVNGQTVTCADPSRVEGALLVPYDYLIVAAGTRHSYFGHPEWERLAPGLKTIEDAINMRGRFLRAFEEAERAQTPEERDAWLTFVIVGAGPTGCELAGVMQEVARAMRKDFRHVDTRDTAVILLEAGPRILPSFPESLAAAAARELAELRVDVRTGAAVTDITQDAVHVGDHAIRTRTVFWAAGNTASPISKCLGVPLTKAGQVIVERDLSIPGHPNVFVIGDLAYALQKDGQPAPGVAQVAMQEGRVAAKNVMASIARQPRADFDYLNKGDIATIGRGKAIANLFGGRVKLSGRPAWWLWLGIHITYLIGFRNRLSVLLQWAYAYFTYQRGVRLITGVPIAQTSDRT